MRILESDDPEWPRRQAGTEPDPYSTQAFQHAEGRALGYRPILVAASAPGWSAHYCLQLWASGQGWIARTPEYGGPWVHVSGAEPATAAAELRAALDLFLGGLGVVSEVAILSPFLPHAAAVRASWNARLEKEVCLADLDSMDDRWRHLSKGRRSDIVRARRELAFSWEPLGVRTAERFADFYELAMAEKEAAPRWRLDREYFVSLAEHPDLDISICSAEGPAGGASALFLRSEQRAAYLYATRWGTTFGSPSAVLWEGQIELGRRGVQQLLLGGGVTAALDDPLRRFKVSLSGRMAPLYIAGRVFDRAGHRAAVDAGLARPLPDGVVEVGEITA